MAKEKKGMKQEENNWNPVNDNKVKLLCPKKKDERKEKKSNFYIFFVPLARDVDRRKNVQLYFKF